MDNEVQALLTIKQCAEYLQVSEITIRRMIERKQLKASKVGDTWRIQKTDILEYLNQNSNK